MITNRNHGPVTDGDIGEFWRETRDGVTIYVRCLRQNENAEGTLILVHGFTTNGSNFTDLAYQLREQFKMNVILPDLRHHGWSQDKPPSFGTAESWDIAACLDWADEAGLAKPYVVMGESLGGMAVQRLIREDPRPDFAICVHPPAWPWDAIGKNIVWYVEQLPSQLKTLLSPFRDRVVGVGHLINAYYKHDISDILNNGDPRQHDPNLPGNPRILYLWGQQDVYEPDKSLQVWRHYYPGLVAEPELRPHNAPDQRKYFITVPGFQHYPPGPTVFEWDGFMALLSSFLLTGNPPHG